MTDLDQHQEQQAQAALPQGMAAFRFSRGVTPRAVPPPRPMSVEMAAPALYVHPDRIRANAATLVKLCSERGIRIMGVTKGVCGEPLVAHAMLSGGVQELGDARLENLQRLRAAGIRAPLWLLRLPQLSQVMETVAVADGSLNSELVTLRALSEAALRLGRPHRVVLMVDLGDRREGVAPRDLVPLARQAATLPGLILDGIGTNLTCFGGVCPSPENLGRLARLARDAERAIGARLVTVSGGNSSSLLLLLGGGLPAGINQLRLGESILLGVEAVEGRPLPGARRDAFLLEAEVIEVKRKPTQPEGERTTNAFGDIPEFPDLGVRCRAICAVGRQDVVPEGLAPQTPGALILGASSDHLLLDVEEAPMRVGDRVHFLPDYTALLAAMTSPYIRKMIVPSPDA